MRRSWVAAGIAVLALGVFAAYRLGPSGTPGAENKISTPGSVASGASTPKGSPAPPSQGRPTGAAGGSSETPAPGTPEAEAQINDNAAGDAKAVGTTSPPAKKWGASIEELARAMAATPSPAPPPGPAASNPIAKPAGISSVTSTSVAKTPAQAAVAPPIVPQPNTQRPAPAATQDPVKPAAAPPVPDDPNADRKPPTLTSLRFDPQQIQDGNSAMLSIGVVDDLSGVKSVFGTMRSPSEVAVIPFVGQDQGTGVFTVSIAIPKKAETGDWFVGTLQILDKADNPLTLAYMKNAVPPGGTLHVSSQDSDSTAPVVHGITMQKSTVAGGDTNWITVAVDDDSSGVASVTGTFQSPSKSAMLPFVCQARGDGTWSGSMTLPNNADCGEWTLRQLRVADKANNAAVLLGDAPEIGHVAFSVASGGGCDSEPPVLDQVSVSPQTVSNASATQVTISVVAHDDGSGVSQVTGRVEGPTAANGQVPRLYFAAQADPKNPTAAIIVTVTIPQFAGTGIWRVASIELTDKARNMRRYDATDPMLANATITVQ